METRSTWFFFFFRPYCSHWKKKCKTALTWFTFSSPCWGKRFNIHACSEPPRYCDKAQMSIYEPFLLYSLSPLCFFLSPIFQAWWTGAKWAVFLLFQQRGHLYSIPGSQVSYSAPLQVMSGPWKVLQINLSWCFEGNLTSMHSSFHSNNYKGIVRKNGQVVRTLSFCFSPDENGNVMRKDIATKHNSAVFFFFFFWGAAEIVKRQGEWQGTKKDYCETAAFYERAPPTFVSFSQMKFRCSFNGILSNLDWFTFIAFIAQIRGKWWGQRGGAASLLKRN